MKPASDSAAKPAVHWLGWDSVLARSADQSGGALVVLEDKAKADGLEWHATNCCYAGWKTLLGTARESVPATEWRAWQQQWNSIEGEHATTEAWPAVLSHDPAESMPEVYRPAPYPETPVGYAASSGAGPLGCDLALLPAVHANWISLTQERFALPSLDVLGGTTPAIPSATDGRYHGERLDLNRIDLGAYLKEVQQTRNLATQVVLHLTGSGERKSSPIRWKDSSLVLYVEPPEREGVTPLTLAPLDTDPSSHKAWIDVENGNLDLIGVEARCPDYKLALVPRYLLRVQGGNLRLHGCRLYGPRAQAPDSYSGLICFEGAGQGLADRAAICTINESVLVSGKTGLECNGSGCRLAVHHSVIVTRGDALSFEPRTTKAKMNLSCELDHATVAAQGRVLRVGSVEGTDVPMEPFVVQAQACAFLAPFAGQHSGLLTCEGTSLAQGVLVWQGEANVYDKRLHSFVTLGGESPERPQPFALWTRLWGPANERQPVLNFPYTNALQWEPLQLERMLLPEIKALSGGQKPRPGADLKALGLLPKSIKPPK